MPANPRARQVERGHRAVARALDADAVRGANARTGRRRLVVRALLLAALWLLPASVAAPDVRAAAPAKADRILVVKSEKRLYLYRGEVALKTYRVALGRNPVGQKERAGDGRTPEGLYRIDAKNPRSVFHKSLHISYPNAADRARAKAKGVALASDIVIHGLDPELARIKAGADHAVMNWTNGCIAVTNEEIDEIWRLVPVGTPIEIRP